MSQQLTLIPPELIPALRLLLAEVGSDRLWTQAQNRCKPAARPTVLHRSRAGGATGWTKRVEGEQDSGCERVVDWVLC